MQILLRSEIQWFHARGKFRKNSVNEDIRLVENDVNPQKASGGGGGGGGGGGVEREGLNVSSRERLKPRVFVILILS